MGGIYRFATLVALALLLAGCPLQRTPVHPTGAAMPPPQVPNNVWNAEGNNLLAQFRRSRINDFGQVIDIGYLAHVLRQNRYVVNPAIGGGNAKHLERTITVGPPSNPINVFHEAIHAIEEFNGETSWVWTSKDFAERNAYWMEFHLASWIPRLGQIEEMVRTGQRDKARAAFDMLRRNFQAGAGPQNATYPHPDASGMNILRRAGYQFDLEQAGRMIEQRFGAFMTPAPPRSGPVIRPAPPPLPPPPLPNQGNCLRRRTPPSNGVGDWVVWSTPMGWLHIGTRTELLRPQMQSEEIWGTLSNAPLIKTPLPGGPFQTREQALEETISRLTRVHKATQPTATPKETVAATYNGVKYNLRFGRGKGVSDILPVGLDYDYGEEFGFMTSSGISPRSFFPQSWMVHVTRMGTLGGDVNLDRWLLVQSQPANGSLTIPDGGGGTYGYRYDISEGPFTDNYALVAAMRRRNVPTLGEHSTQSVLDPARDYGLPLCR